MTAAIGWPVPLLVPKSSPLLQYPSIWSAGVATGTLLGPGKAFVVYSGASAIPAGLANAVAASTGSLALGNSGDSVILKDGGGVVKTSYSYPSSLSGTDGVSMNRSPDATATGSFVLHTALGSLTSSAGTRANGSAF